MTKKRVRPVEEFPWPQRFTALHMEVFQHLKVHEEWYRRNLPVSSASKFRMDYYKFAQKVKEDGRNQLMLPAGDRNPILGEAFIIADKLTLTYRRVDEETQNLIIQRDPLYDDYFREKYFYDLYQIELWSNPRAVFAPWYQCFYDDLPEVRQEYLAGLMQLGDPRLTRKAMRYMAKYFPAFFEADHINEGHIKAKPIARPIVDIVKVVSDKKTSAKAPNAIKNFLEEAIKDY